MRFLLICCLSVFLFSCKKNEPGDDVQLFVTGTMNADFTPVNVNGRQTVFNKFRFYLSGIKWITTDNDTILAKNYFLYDFPSNDASTNVDGLLQPSDPSKIKAIVFSIGLDSILNNSNPVTFPSGHPLSLDKDMYWGMLKYRFLVTEGSFDSTASKTGVTDFPFSIHLGTNVLYRQLSFPISISAGTPVNITFNPARIFDGPEGVLDLRDNYSNHSDPGEIPKAIKLMNNFAAGISVETPVYIH